MVSTAFYTKSAKNMSGTIGMVSNIAEMANKSPVGQAINSVTGSAAEQLGYALGDATGYHDKLDKRQAEQTETLMGIQQKKNHETMDKAYKMNSPKAEKQRLKDAGLSVGLMYGGKGAGGGTVQSQGVSGGSAANSAQMKSANTASSGLGIAMQKMQSEIDVNKSIAAANNANAKKTSGIDTDLATSQIEKIDAEISKLNADKALTNSKVDLTKLQSNSVAIENEYNVENNKTLLKQNIDIARKLSVEADVSEESKNALINTIKTNYSKVVSDIVLNNAKTEKTSKEANAIKMHVMKIMNDVKIDNKQLSINEESMRNAWNNNVMQATSSTLSKTWRALYVDVKKALGGMFGGRSHMVDREY